MRVHPAHLALAVTRFGIRRPRLVTPGWLVFVRVGAGRAVEAGRIVRGQAPSGWSGDRGETRIGGDWHGWLSHWDGLPLDRGPVLGVARRGFPIDRCET